MSNVLIVTFHFPPDNNISARRWAKFSKYIHRKGHKVYVLTTHIRKKSSINLSWNDDVKGIKIYRIKNKYSPYLSGNPKTWHEKILYKVHYILYRFLYKGNIYDRALKSKKIILRESVKIITKHAINTIIVNGPPHRLMYYISLLKKRFPNVNFIFDFRDPWTWWYNLGYRNLSDKRKKIEFYMQTNVIKNADAVLVPIEEMKNKIQELYPDILPGKIVVLPHAYDEDDIVIDKALIKNNTKQEINFVYFGSLYLGLEKFYSKLISQLNQFQQAKLHIYTGDGNYNNIFRKSNKVFVHPYINTSKLFKTIVSNCDYFLLVYPEEFKNYFSSKFYEIIALRMPILYFGYPGETAEFIINNKLGVFVNIENDYFLQDALAKLKQLDYNYNFNISAYTFKYITNNILEPIIKNELH